MRLRLSIFLLCALGASPALGDALSPCPAPEMSYTCESGSPALRVTRSLRSASLDLKLGASQAGGALGDALMSLPSGEISLALPLSNLPDTAQQIAIVGSDADGACCVSTATLAPPPIGFCDATEASSDTIEETETIPDLDTVFDIALSFDLEPTCPEGAANHSCSGALDISVTGAPAGILPLSLEIDPKAGLDTALSGPLTCYDTGAGSQFCRAPADILGTGLTLPIQISATPSYEKRTARLCVSLALPNDPSAQIRLVQTALRALNYDPESIDGQNGPSTRAAVKSLAARFGLDIEDPLDPAFLALLGLGPFADADASNNQACAQTILPPRPRPKIVEKPRRKPTSTPRKPDVVYEPPPLVCDPLSTVLRGRECACRYEGMIRYNATTCVCQNGRAPAAGAQCG